MNWDTLPLLVLALLVGLVAWRAWRHWQYRWRLRYLTAFECPGWMLKGLRQTYPHLGPQDLMEVQNGLRQFLRICLQARGRQVAMPSQVVDALWHALILDTRRYQHLCRQAFGHVLHHTPAQAMSTQARRNEPLRRAWRLACRDEQLDPRNAKQLPLLFALDTRLAIPGGFRYAPDCSAKGNTDSYCGNSLGCSSSGCSGSSDSSGSSEGGGDSGGDGGGGCGGGGGD